MAEGSLSSSANPIPMLEEKVDALTMQLSQLVYLIALQNHTQPSTEEEVEDFLSHHEKELPMSSDGKVVLI